MQYGSLAESVLRMNSALHPPATYPVFSPHSPYARSIADRDAVMREIPVTSQSMRELERFDKIAGMLSWLCSCDHKQIGILYLLTALGFFVIGGCEALVMRLQLAVANSHLLKPEAYDQLFTLHGTTMIFLVIMPTLLGLAVYLLPLMIGARDMAFPRLNALSYWLLLFGGVFLYGCAETARKISPFTHPGAPTWAAPCVGFRTPNSSCVLATEVADCAGQISLM